MPKKKYKVTVYYYNTDDPDEFPYPLGTVELSADNEKQAVDDAFLMLWDDRLDVASCQPRIEAEEINPPSSGFVKVSLVSSVVVKDDEEHIARAQNYLLEQVKKAKDITELSFIEEDLPYATEDSVPEELK